MDELRPIATSSPTTATQPEPVLVFICGGPEREGDGPRDPYADVMAGIRFPCETNR